MYFSINAIEAAFASQGIDVHWDEATSEQDLQSRVEQLEALSKIQLQAIGDHLMAENAEQWEKFLQCLRNALERTIESISVTSLFGISKIFGSVEYACGYIVSDTKESDLGKTAFHSYEIIVTYSNGDRIDMRFKEQQAALASLQRLL